VTTRPAQRGWPAPAKLNLFLHITGRRPDGYHTLQTVFQIIDLADTLEVEPTSAGDIERVGGPDSIPAEADLIVRAARALKAATGTTQGARLRLHKRIPIGGGLGGGSSDAATALIALNECWQTGVDLLRLAAIGLELGADVPVFVHGRSAWAGGIGDVLEPVDLPDRWFVVIDPGVAVSTAELFQAPELTRNSPVITIRGFLDSGGRNDFEPVVSARYPAVRDALAWLRRRGEARLTGTGGCVFAPFESAGAAERVAAAVPDAWRSVVARGLAASPLLARRAASGTSGQG
jgi:4-diphosphocytidyl-2-C-methyl-D-erythritol kinase